ncbi:MAG: pyrroline-5-carboxylate reductase [Spirochaetes bacterium]|jgi:pyrroline-5-carboxylate reductase|nr:pyrroline-5-carboxylate reductase [Spirochaetota bacterium]
MNNKTGFIGLGNMGSALIKGLSATTSAESIYGFDTDKTKTEKLSTLITACNDTQQLLDTCGTVIIAVKPHIVPLLLESLTISPSTIVVSIAAGITIETMSKATSPNQKIVRVMPNTPALAGEGMSVLSANSNVTKEEMESVSAIFAKTGKTIIADEKHMDAVTAMSGCGPAYFFTFIQAMADGGVKLGLSREQAVTLAAQTALGAAKMVLTGEDDPITLRNKVTSPGGSTIAAVHVLEQNGFSGIVMDAVEEAASVSSRLG